MNDLDTSFVNPISQGLTRRFQFVTVGVPETEVGASGISAEVRSSFDSAHTWLLETYGAVLPVASANDAMDALESSLMLTQDLVAGLRASEGEAAGWPIGTAQVVDVFRVLLLQTVSGIDAARALDWAIADRLIPQMGQLDEAQLARAESLFEASQLDNARRALEHLRDPHGL